AAHRQSRTYHPPADACPLCPSRDGRQSEIPAPGRRPAQPRGPVGARTGAGAVRMRDRRPAAVAGGAACAPCGVAA
ncbi:hypothetical protein ABT264_25620, partial [Streptomyces virginiae]